MVRRTVLVGAFMLALAGHARAEAPSAMVLVGKGVQVYDCSAAGSGFAWQLKAPDAVLTDGDGQRVGRHFAGPSWQAEDGSTVVGEPLIASLAPQPGAIPWLVLRAKAHSGEGLFAQVSYIVRSATTGGVAPTAGCDAAHAGDEARVEYSAIYTLFPSIGPLPNR